MNRFFLGILAAAAFLASAAGAQPDSIVVGGGQFHPMFLKSERGIAMGRDVDLWRLWSIKTGIPVKFRIMDWPDVIPALLNGDIDVVDGATYTPERALQLAFTEPYQELLSHFFYHKNSKPIHGLADLSGRAVGVLEGTNVEEFLRFNAPTATLVPFRDYEALVNAAINKHINVFIAEEPLVSYYLTLAGGAGDFHRSKSIILDSSLCMAVRRDDAELLELINSGFAQITDQERRQINEGWFKVSLDTGLYSRMRYLWPLLLLGIFAALAAMGGLARTWFRELPDMQAVREKFVNMWLVFAAIASLPLGLISIMRAHEFGWNHQLTMHVVIVIIVVLLALFRNYVHYYLRTALMLILLYLVGLGGLLVYGIVGPTMLPLTSLVVATIFMFGLRGGMVCIFATLATLGGVGLAVHTGMWRYSFDIAAYAASLPAWAHTFVLYAFYTVGLGLGTAAFYRHMEEALQAQRTSEAMFRGLVETSSDWIWETDAKGNFCYASPQVEAILGYKPDEVVGKKFYALMPSEERKQLADTFRNLAREGKTITALENTNLHKEGRRVVLESSGVPVFDAEGRVAGYRGIARDITERKKSEEEREQLMFAIEQAGESIVITDAAATIQYVNPAFERVTGYTRKEAVGQSLRMLEDNISDVETSKNAWETLSRGEIWSGRLKSKKKDGTPFTEETTISPVRDASGRTVNYIAVQRDITNEVMLEEQLRQAQKMEAVGQLAGGVAHDFNNLLQAILGYGDLAMSEADDGQAVRGSIEEIMNASRRAATLVRQLLAFSRQQPLDMTEVNLNSVVAELAKMIRRVIGEHIALEISADETLGFVRADCGQVEQILLNLCVNARDAMPGGGVITIATQSIFLDEDFCRARGWDKPGLYACLSVTDTGCGMDGETQGKAFEPFFTTKPMHKGTGLGLSMVYGLVKQHGGFVHLNSEIGRGTTFKIYLPAVEHGAAAPDTREKRPVPSGTETILVAEDDDMVRRLNGTVLERSGYTVILAVDGAEAVRAFEEHSADIALVILDVIMPNLSGLAACEQIRKMRPQTPVLFTSGYSVETVHTNVLLDRVTQMIPKPHHPDDLLRKVREMLDSGAA